MQVLRTLAAQITAAPSPTSVHTARHNNGSREPILDGAEMSDSESMHRRRQLEDQGYCVARDVLPRCMVARLRTATD
eukprot:SAG31_NODE_17261_length_677_cov_1.538062_1_plen_76_part_01